ncbi:MAG: tyrosine-type recombinase/integrase [Piscinibacter sp.]
MADLIDLYMAQYEGRDQTRVSRLDYWRERVGKVALQDFSDDHVHQVLEDMATRPARVYAGKDAAGRRQYVFKKHPTSAATLNRYTAAIGAVCTFAIRKRIAPKGWVHPCRSIERRPENNARTRFLSDEEARRLLQACRGAAWPRLYALVLLALTTGARKGELLGLRWSDVDLEQGLATLARTKNGSARVLPLVPAAVDELAKFKGAPTAWVFESPRDPKRVFSFDAQWRRALAEAKLKDVVLHTCRHTAASMLAQAGASTVELADVLGHRDLKMVARYAHMSTGHKSALVTRVLGSLG